MTKHIVSSIVVSLSVAGLAQAQTPAPTTAPTSALNEVGESARRDLDKSLQELAALRESIRAEKLPLSEELSNLEAQLTAARRQLDDTARAQDAETLESTNLGAALKLRQDEAVYVGNLLDEYTRGFEGGLHVSEHTKYGPVVDVAKLARQNADLTTVDKLGRQFDVLRASLARAGDVLGGTRYPGEAVDPQGNIATGDFAMIGPIVMFAGKGGASAGFALPQTGSLKAALRPVDPKLTAGLIQIVGSGEGTLPLDPSRGGALQELIKKTSLLYYFKKGGPIMYPLLLVSLLALTVVFERLFFMAREQRRRDPEAVDALLARVEQGDIDGAIAAGAKSPDFVVRALTYALRHRKKSLSNALIRASAQELVRFTRGISILDTCITAAPLLGLLGTVTGMMGSFGMLGGGELSAPAQITGGIAEALIATAFGLGIAITALIPMNYLHNKSEHARHEIEDAGTHLEILMKPILDAESDLLRQQAFDRMSEQQLATARAS